MDAFRLEPAKASKVMMTAHTQGECVVIITTKDEAETRLSAARTMIARAEPGRDYVRLHGPQQECELQFALRKDSE
jgi:ATP-dependent Clp protease adapter protein ClpS